MPTTADRILIVDDEVEITRALRRLLRRTYEVETAVGGADALGLLETFKPDVVMSDYRMPDMNGAQLMGEIRRRLPLCLRLILSGNADLEAVVASVNQGEVCRVLRKPWDGEELLATLAQLLEARRALATLYRPFAELRAEEAGASSAEPLQEGARLLVRARTRKPFAAGQASAVLGALLGSSPGSDLQAAGELIERHAGKVSFVAEAGGEQTLTLEVPLHDGALPPRNLP